MNDLVIQTKDNGQSISTETASLIQPSAVPNTFLAYGGAIQQ